MEILEIIMLSLAMSMDTFAVSVSNGIKYANKQNKVVGALTSSTLFAFFHYIMLILGYVLAEKLSFEIQRFDHYIIFIFILLTFIGVKMILHKQDKNVKKDDYKKDEKFNIEDKKFVIETIVLGIGTSIDALAVGVAYYFMHETINKNITFLTITATVFIFSVIGYIIGNRFGSKNAKKAEIFGGAVLILLACKILVEHLIKGI